MTIKLTIKQRLNLEGMIRQQRGADDESMELLVDLRKKIRIPEEERSQFVRTLPDGNVLADEFAIRRASTLPRYEVSLNTPEMRRVRSLLEQWKSYNVDDKEEWADDLKAQVLEEMKNSIAKVE